MRLDTDPFIDSVKPFQILGGCLDRCETINIRCHIGKETRVSGMTSMWTKVMGEASGGGAAGLVEASEKSWPF